jgi:hypothetical protein
MLRIFSEATTILVAFSVKMVENPLRVLENLNGLSAEIGVMEPSKDSHTWILVKRFLC